MKTLARLMLAGAFVLTLGSSGFAQMPAATPAAPAAPGVPKAPAIPKAPAMPKVPTADDTVKKAKAQECSAKADAQGLHGKAREEFRAKCKKS